MEESIRQTDKRVKLAFICFWLLPLLMVATGETLDEQAGILAGNIRASYWGETLTILLTALCIPVALKSFSWALHKKINLLSLPEALKAYQGWSCVRMALLALPACAGLLTYYLTWSSTGLLCTLIALTASLFCCPGQKRLRNELHIEKEEQA